MSRRNRHNIMVQSFLERVNQDPTLPAGAFKVAFVLAHHFNRKTKLAWPSERTIAEATALTERWVRKMLKALADRQYIEIWVSRGRTRSNRYRPLPASENRNSSSGFTAAKRAKTTPKSATERSTNAPTKPLKYKNYGEIAEQRGANALAKVVTSASAPTDVVDAKNALYTSEIGHGDGGHQKPENRNSSVVKPELAFRQPSDEAADGTPAPASGALTGPEPSPTAAKEFGAMLDDGNGKPIWLEGIRHKPRELYTEKPDLLIGARIESDKMVGTIIGYHDTEFALVRFDAQMVGGVHVDEMVAWTKISDITVTAPPPGYQVGDTVRHLRYEIGIVAVVDGSTCEVDFKSGRKRIMRSFIDPVATAA